MHCAHHKTSVPVQDASPCPPFLPHAPLHAHHKHDPTSPPFPNQPLHSHADTNAPFTSPCPSPAGSPTLLMSPPEPHLPSFPSTPTLTHQQGCKPPHFVHLLPHVPLRRSHHLDPRLCILPQSLPNIHMHKPTLRRTLSTSCLTSHSVDATTCSPHLPLLPHPSLTFKNTNKPFNSPCPPPAARNTLLMPPPETHLPSFPSPPSLTQQHGCKPPHLVHLLPYVPFRRRHHLDPGLRIIPLKS